MLQATYENHIHSTSDLYVIFHDLILTQDAPSNDSVHWHESIELIYVTQGMCTVTCDLVPIKAYPGDLVVINCNELHSFKACTSSTHYYCLIINRLDYDQLPFSLDDVTFDRIIRSPRLWQIFLKIINEMRYRPPHFKFTVKSLITYLIIELLREHTLSKQLLPTMVSKDPKILMVQEAILYIHKNLTRNLSLEEICAHVGFSKYYFCHTFKEVTQKTVIQFINHLQCEYAQKLIYAGHYTIAEVSDLCDFNSLPYFYRIYKKYQGAPPSSSKHSL